MTFRVKTYSFGSSRLYTPISYTQATLSGKIWLVESDKMFGWWRKLELTKNKTNENYIQQKLGLTKSFDLRKF